MQRVLAVLLALALLPAIKVSAQQPDIPSLTISGGDLARPVTVAPADVDSFRRRVNTLPRLEDEPATTGPSYTVITSYWSEAVLLEEDEDELDVSVKGVYFPEGGFVLLTLDDPATTAADPEDVWVVINLRQRTILDRYIRLSNEGLIGPAPTALEVLTAASSTEQFGVQAGTRVLTPAEVDGFWKLVSGLSPLDIPPNPEFVPPDEAPNLIWLTVVLPEGRSLRFLNDAVSGTLVEPLSQDVYAVDKDWLAPILGPYDPTTIGVTLGSAIKQEEPAGSWLWWPVMLGGGLTLIGAAVWLRRRQGATPGSLV